MKRPDSTSSRRVGLRLRAFKRAAHLVSGISAGGLPDPIREAGRLLEHETAVQQIQRLQGGDRTAPARRDLRSIRAVESAEHAILLQARLELVDHPPPFRRAEFLLRRIDANIIVIRLKHIEARAANAQIELASGGKYRVAQLLGLETLR